MTERLPRLAALGLAGIGGMHLVWATGSPWPASDRTGLADAVVGRRDGTVPPAAACVAVAGACGLAATLVAGHPRRLPRVRRLGATGVVATLLTRGALGLAGRTDLVSPGSTSPTFRRRDRAVYAPLCLALAALSAPSLRGDPAHPRP